MSSLFEPCLRGDIYVEAQCIAPPLFDIQKQITTVAAVVAFPSVGIAATVVAVDRDHRVAVAVDPQLDKAADKDHRVADTATAGTA